MSIERGLGKGLDALLGEASLRTQEGGSVLLPIEQIEPSVRQPRKRFEEGSLSELAGSIRENGLLQPLTVRRLSSGCYQIIAGERRWRAAKMVGLEELPAMVIEADDRKVMELGLVENLQREDLNPMEEAAGYRTLMEEYGLTQEEVSARIGKSRPAVGNALRLLALPDAVRLLVEEGRISAGHARAILAAPDKDTQKSLARQVVEEGLSVRQTEALARRAATGKDAAEPDVPEVLEQTGAGAFVSELEAGLSFSFKRKVKIVAGKKRGRIEFEYSDAEDLKSLLRALGQLAPSNE